MSWYDNFKEEIFGVVATAWPEVGLRKVFTTNQAVKVKVSDLMEGEETDTEQVQILPPVSILRLGEIEGEMDWGAANRMFRLPLEIWYVDIHRDREGTDNATYVFGRLYSLATYIRNDWTYFTQIEEPTIDVSENNDVNRELDDSKFHVMAGVLKFSPGLLVGEVRS